MIYGMAQKSEPQDLIPILNWLDRGNSSFSAAVQRSEGSYAAEFFAKVVDGKDQEEALGILRGSRSFQAGLENEGFVSRLRENHPQYLSAIAQQEAGLDHSHS